MTSREPEPPYFEDLLSRFQSLLQTHPLVGEDATQEIMRELRREPMYGLTAVCGRDGFPAMKGALHNPALAEALRMHAPVQTARGREWRDLSYTPGRDFLRSRWHEVVEGGTGLIEADGQKIAVCFGCGEAHAYSGIKDPLKPASWTNLVLLGGKGPVNFHSHPRTRCYAVGDGSKTREQLNLEQGKCVVRSHDSYPKNTWSSFQTSKLHRSLYTGLIHSDRELKRCDLCGMLTEGKLRPSDHKQSCRAIKASHGRLGTTDITFTKESGPWHVKDYLRVPE